MLGTPEIGTDIHGNVPLRESKIDFLGFSHDDSHAAWAVHVIAPHGKESDSYRLRILAGPGGILEFQTGPILRINRDGRRLKLPQALLLKANPRVAKAQPESLWAQATKGLKLRRRNFSPKPGNVRLLGDSDTSVEVKSTKKSIQLNSPAGLALGYHVAVRDIGGHNTLLGHFRVEAKNGRALRATLRSHVSPSGFAFALVNQFSGSDSADSRAEIRIIQLLKHPVIIRLSLRDEHFRKVALGHSGEISDLEKEFLKYSGSWGGMTQYQAPKESRADKAALTQRTMSGFIYMKAGDKSVPTNLDDAWKRWAKNYITPDPLVEGTKKRPSIE